MDKIIHLAFLWTVSVSVSASEEYYYQPYNVSRTTPSGIAAYRSALTLDWLAAEDTRQRELVAAFETEPLPPSKILATDCISYPRPAAGKVARLMLELLKNLEGDEGVLVTELIHTLIRSKLLVLETSVFESEPDLDALVKTPGLMMGEPHITFPRILAMVWMTVTDSSTMKLHGWCTINKVNKYLTAAKPHDIAKNLRALEPIVARARFIMEEFIQHVTPLNMMMKDTSTTKRKEVKSHKSTFHSALNPKLNFRSARKQHLEQLKKGPSLLNTTVKMRTTTYNPARFMGSEGDIFLSNSSWRVVPQICKFFLVIVFVRFFN